MEGKRPPKVPELLRERGSGLVKLYEGCLSAVSAKRPSLEEVVQHFSPNLSSRQSGAGTWGGFAAPGPDYSAMPREPFEDSGCADAGLENPPPSIFPGYTRLLPVSSPASVADARGKAGRETSDLGGQRRSMPPPPPPPVSPTVGYTNAGPAPSEPQTDAPPTMAAVDDDPVPHETGASSGSGSSSPGNSGRNAEQELDALPRAATLARSLGPDPSTFTSPIHAVELELEAGSLAEEVPFPVKVTPSLEFVECRTEGSGR